MTNGSEPFRGWRPVASFVAWTLGVGAFAAASQAQPNAHEVQERQLEEIVVTARKREESLRDVPGSAAALTEGFLEDIGGIQDLRDLTDQIVGITITEGQLPSVTEPSIRGAGQARNRMSVSATGIYRNGAYIAGKGIGGRNFTRMDSFDIGQVEVYRGPQGAMYGRNALGGAIHLITRRPVDERSLDVGVTVGDNERLQYEAILNLPLSESLSTRFGYEHDEYDDGFYSDINGEPVDTPSYQHGRAAIRFDPGAWDINYVFDVMDSVFTPAITVNPRAAVREANNNDPFQTLINSRHEGYHDVRNHSLQIDYATGGGTITWISNVRDREMGWVKDPDHDDNNVNQATRTNVNSNDTTEDLQYHELRYISEASERLSFIVGADFYAADTDETVIVVFPHLASNTLARFNEPTGLVYDAAIGITQDSWSVYGQIEYVLASLPLTLSAEARYAVDDVAGNVAIYQPYQGCAATLGEPPCTMVDGGDEYRNVPWTLTASWDLASLPSIVTSANVYGKVASSYRHGGLNLSAGLPSDAFDVKPLYQEERSMTWEVGTKSSWFDNRMQMNLSVFRTDYEDFLNTTTNGCPDQCPFLDPETFQSLGFNPDGTRIEQTPAGEDGIQSGTSFFIDNIGDVEAWGYELELQTRAALGRARLTTTLGFARQIGEVESIRPDVSPANLDVLGARLNRMRPRQWKATGRYRLPLSEALDLLVVASWVSERGGTQELPPAGGGPAIALDDLERLDARIGLEGDRWSLFFEGNNITDDQYVLNEAGNGSVRVNDPEYYALSFKWRIQ